MERSVQVEEIMEGIRKEIADRGLSDEILSIDTIPRESAAVGILWQRLRQTGIALLNYLYLRVYKRTPKEFRVFFKKYFQKVDTGFTFRRRG